LTLGPSRISWGRRFGATQEDHGEMPKSARSKAKSTKPRARLAPESRAERARSRGTDAGPAARPPTRSAAMRLAAEVERLERELAAAKSRMAALETRADVDPLTDLVNRRGFEREFKRALAYVKRYGTSAALVYIDLDGLKPVNDGHGHAAGDAVLKAVAMVLTRHVRACDLVARVGGDEFIVLLWNVGEADAQSKARALEAAVARMTATHAGASLTVGASAGVAMVYPLDTPAKALERADQAMYVRKSLRRGAQTTRS
jgi:diguanylate cyclase (GGDEF)-like protein